MTEAILNLIKGDKIELDTDYRDFLPVNMTAVRRNIRGAKGYMLSHPGLASFATGVSVDRGGVWNERLLEHLRISGEMLISVASDGTTTQIGSITGTDRASLAYSFNTQSIVTDGKWWYYDGTTLTQSTDSDLGVPIDITWIDNYYFFTDGEFVYHTDITDETSISPNKFSTSEFSPDPTLAVDKTSDDQVIIFDRYTTSYMTNVAAEDFAFTWIKGKTIKCGVAGTHCETELEGVFYILGGGKEEAPSVHYLSAGTYKSIATREVDKIIATYNETELASAVLETRVQDSDRFILVRLPDHTLLFNLTIAEAFGLEFAWTTLTTGLSGDAWRGANGVYDTRVSDWIYGDTLNSNIGILDNTVGTQYGEQVENILYTPIVNMESASIDELELDIIPGHQLMNSDEVTVAVSTTYDGVTFGKEFWQLYSTPSDYNLRFVLYRLGYVRNFIGFKFRSVTGERLAFSLCRLLYG